MPRANTLIRRYHAIPLAERDIYKSNDHAARILVYRYPGAQIYRTKILREGRSIFLKCNFWYGGRDQVLVFDQTPAWEKQEGVFFLNESPGTVAEIHSTVPRSRR